MVRVLVIADEEAPNLRPGTIREIAPDLVLSAGDLPWHYIEYVASCIDVPVVFVPGNHDPKLSSRAPRLRGGAYDAQDVDCDGPRPFGAQCIDQDVVEAAGLRIAGLGGCVRYNSGPHQYTQRQYVGRARRLLRRAKRLGQIDVLLTHAPPLGLGDAEDRPHHGIEALHGVLERLEPSWHVHGHIHPYGQTMPDRTVGRTVVANVIPWRVLEITPKTSQISVSSR